MKTDKAFQIFESYMGSKKLRHSRPRREIMEAFFRAGRHLTAEELYLLVKRSSPKLGFATVYRTLKLMVEAGLCHELKFMGGSNRYELLVGLRHHDHIVCTGCGACVEVVDPEIERLQDRLFRRHGFIPQRHRLELFGLCGNCQKRCRCQAPVETKKSPPA